jgi:multisubunit Na+/H+ antiporter MnhF subunit
MIPESDGWLLAAAVLMLALLPCMWGCLRGRSLGQRIIALEQAGIIVVFDLLLMAKGYGFAAFADVALVVAVLNFSGILVLCFLIERWL